MKTELLLLAFLLFSFLSKPLLTEADSEPEAVLDTDGKKLRAGANYYIVQIMNKPMGGLTLATRGNKTCPLEVVRALNGYDNGLPLTFSPINSKKGIIRLSTDLNIKYSHATKCPESTVWKVGSFDEQYGVSFITLGGVEGNPGPNTLSNWFKIEKFMGYYKLVHCPTVCKYCTATCSDIGLYNQNGNIRLVLSDVPYFRVMFKKA